MSRRDFFQKHNDSKLCTISTSIINSTCLTMNTTTHTILHYLSCVCVLYGANMTFKTGSFHTRALLLSPASMMFFCVFLCGSGSEGFWLIFSCKHKPTVSGPVYLSFLMHTHVFITVLHHQNECGCGDCVSLKWWYSLRVTEWKRNEPTATETQTTKRSTSDISFNFI